MSTIVLNSKYHSVQYNIKKQHSILFGGLRLLVQYVIIRMQRDTRFLDDQAFDDCMTFCLGVSLSTTSAQEPRGGSNFLSQTFPISFDLSRGLSVLSANIAWAAHELPEPLNAWTNCETKLKSIIKHALGFCAALIVF